MSPTRQAQLGGLNGSGVYSGPQQPDYAGAIASLANVFATHRQGLIERAYRMQQAKQTQANVEAQRAIEERRVASEEARNARAQEIEDARLAAEGFVPSQRVRVPGKPITSPTGVDQSQGDSPTAPVIGTTPDAEQVVPAHFDPTKSVRGQQEETKRVRLLGAYKSGDPAEILANGGRLVPTPKAASSGGKRVGKPPAAPKPPNPISWIGTHALQIQRDSRKPKYAGAPSGTGIDLEEAKKQAQAQYEQLYGHVPAAGAAPAPADGSTGNIDLRTPKAPSATPEEAAQKAIQVIDSGAGTLDDALSHTALSDAAKAILRAHYAQKKAPGVAAPSTGDRF